MTGSTQRVKPGPAGGYLPPEARSVLLTAQVPTPVLERIGEAARRCGVGPATWATEVVEATVGGGPGPSGCAAEDAVLRGVRLAANETGWLGELVALFADGPQITAPERWAGVATLDRGVGTVRDLCARRQRQSTAARAQESREVCRHAVWIAAQAGVAVHRSTAGESSRLTFRTSVTARKSVKDICEANSWPASRFLGAVLGVVVSRLPGPEVPDEVLAAGDLAGRIRQRGRRVFALVERAEHSGTGWDEIRKELVMSTEDLSEVERLLRQAVGSDIPQGIDHVEMVEAVPNGDWVGPGMPEEVRVDPPEDLGQDPA